MSPLGTRISKQAACRTYLQVVVPNHILEAVQEFVNYEFYNNLLCRTLLSGRVLIIDDVVP